MKLSVVIPTHNRKEILELTLSALNNQNYPPEEYEVLIVDDGSTDGTSARILSQLSKFRMRVTLLRQAQRGPAAARNLALNRAEGEIVLFCNDDIIPGPDFVLEHVVFHEREPGLSVGLLGRVSWSPEIRVTPFMHWLEHGGPQFKYDELKPGEIGWRYFWTCNLSLKREFLLLNGIFDEEFPFAAWEDVELGYRLNKCGLRLLYSEAATGYHHHSITLESAKQKMLTHGWSAVIMDGKVPHEAKPSSLKSPHKQVIRILDTIFLCKPAMFACWRLAKWAEHRTNLGFLFNLVTLHYRVEGQRKGERARRKAAQKE